jgi:hypothetical protein
MPDPVQLPNELFLVIINYATAREDDQDDMERTKKKALCNLSLVSSQWHAVLIEQIYSTWKHDCDENSISSLWKFLRTILSNRQIADTVREIRYQTLGLGGERFNYAISPPVFSLGDRDMTQNAIFKAGLGHIKPDVINAINNADPKPLLALLLANLRNLRTLHACLPHTDMFLAGVVRGAVKCHQNQPQNENCPLRNLRDVYLKCARWFCYECDYPQYIHVNLLWPIFQLPAIQRLSVSDFKIHEGASRAEYSEDFGDIFNASSVMDLNLVLNDEPDPCLGTRDSLILLALPKTLTRLSVYLERRSRFPRSNLCTPFDLWNGIRQYAGSIEYLDVCGGHGYLRTNNDDDDETKKAKKSHFGSLQDFTRLERLYIEPEVLLGGKYSFRDTLPPNLKSLNFYYDGGLSFRETFSQQLQDFISRVHLHAPSLCHIALDQYDSRSLLDSDVIYDQVGNVCKEHGIKFEAKKLSKYSEGPRHW